MNRLVLIGNGFDLAHGLKTRYEDFIYWYWKDKSNHFCDVHSDIFEDELCQLKIKDCSWYELQWLNEFNFGGLDGQGVYNCLKDNSNIFQISFSPLFERIHKSIETKNWVDIENDYYDLLKKYVKDGDLLGIDKLNTHFHALLEKLIQYLSTLDIPNQPKKVIKQKIYAPFEASDISVSGQEALKEHIRSGLKLDDRGWERKLISYGDTYSIGVVDDYKKRTRKDYIPIDNLTPKELFLPNRILLLNFNYTNTINNYIEKADSFEDNYIHGYLSNPSSMVFGYGDELDGDYKTLLEMNNNKLLCNIKSIKYLEASNYRQLLQFIESEPFQIIIMGHSCGNSDRTLLNTLFEHKNCVSIKPYYHKWDDGDNFIELVQNISRNFKDMKLMRDRVVNKTYCESLT